MYYELLISDLDTNIQARNFKFLSSTFLFKTALKDPVESEPTDYLESVSSMFYSKFLPYNVKLISDVTTTFKFNPRAVICPLLMMMNEKIADNFYLWTDLTVRVIT